MHIPYLKENEILKYDYCFFLYGSISRKLINTINKKENILVILMDKQITINEKNIDYCKNVALRKFTLQAFPFHVRQNSEYKAYKAIDDVYEALRHKSGIPQKTLTNMYKDKQVELAYKRFVIDCIKNVFILDNILQQLNDHNIQFDIFANLRLYKSIHWFNGKNERFFLSNIRIKHVKYNGFFLIDKILHNMMWSIRMLILPFYILLKARRIDIFKKTKDIKMAILVFSSDWRLSDNSLIPSVDWPINNKELDATNTIFVSELSLDSEYKEQFNRRNYVYEDLSTFNRQNLFFIFSKLLYLSTTNLLNIFKDAVYGDKLLLEVSVKGIYVFYQWSLFSLYWNTKKTLCYQGGGYRDIFRNIVLRKHNCESWRYDHTFNFNFNIYDNSVGVPEPTTELAFLNYTYEMHWGALNTSAFLSSKSHSINHLTTLPVWQYVFDSVSKQDIKDVIREKIPDKGKIISAFNSSFTPGSYNGVSNHLSFLKLLNRLFESSLNKNQTH